MTISSLIFRTAAILAAAALTVSASLPVYHMAARVAGIGLG